MDTSASKILGSVVNFSSQLYVLTQTDVIRVAADRSLS